MASIVDSWWARSSRPNPRTKLTPSQTRDADEFLEGWTSAEREIRDDRWTQNTAREYLAAIGGAPPRDSFERGYNQRVILLAGSL